MALLVTKPVATWAALAVTCLIVSFKLLKGFTTSLDGVSFAPTSWSSYGIFSGENAASISDIDPTRLLEPRTELDAFCAHHRLAPFPDRYHHRKLYDLIFVNDDLDWLQIHLAQMAPYIDFFVIMESVTDFANSQKPLYIQENWESFTPFHAKMIVQNLNESDKNFPKSGGRPKQEVLDERIAFSRNSLFTQMFPALTGPATPSHGDVILYSEVNELVRPEVLSVLRNCAIPRRLRLITKTYLYSFQWLRKGVGKGIWEHPDATFFDGIETTIHPHVLRTEPPEAELWHAGWRCEFCTRSLRQLRRTMGSSRDLSRLGLLEPRKIVERVRDGLDVLKLEDGDGKRVDNNLDIPEFLAQNRQGYEYLFSRDGEDAGFEDYAEVLQEAST